MKPRGLAKAIGVITMLSAVSIGSRAEEIIPPAVVARDQWRAAPHNPALMKTQTISGIIIHHTDTAQAPQRPLEEKLRNLQSFSQRPGTLSGTGKAKPAWGDLPYHYYIDVRGRIGEGRRLEFAGDTNTGYKTQGYVQIVLEGKFEKEKPTVQQLSALDELVAWLVRSQKIKPSAITSHNDHAASDCPGKNLKPHIELLRDRFLREAYDAKVAPRR